MLQKKDRILSVDDGRFSYTLTGRDLGWKRIGFTLGTSHGTGQAGFEYYMETGAEPFQCTATAETEDGFELHGRYNAPGLEETVTLRLLGNGALRVARRITNTGKISLVLRSAGAGDGGRPVFSDNHIWRARYAHLDNVRTEKFPWCRPEYPYVRPLPKTDTVLGNQESQAIPALMLTNDTYSQLLLEGQLRQERTRAQWTIAAGAGAPVRTYGLQWSMHTGGFELHAGGSLDLEPMYYEILENAHPQEAWAGYIDAVTAENQLLSADDTLLSKAFYCSWNYGVFADISEEKLMKTARCVAANMPDVKHFLIDGAWQNHLIDPVDCPTTAQFYLPEGQWHHPVKFPKGMKAMADAIRATGLTPGIWWTPMVGLYSKLAQEHPEWLAKDATGNVYRIVHSGYLDYSQKPVQEYLHKIFTILFKEWGFEGMKMDFWSQGVESEQIRYATGTGVQWRDWLLSTIRSYLPPDGFLMTCVAVSMGNPFLGKGASSYRCGIDVGACTWREHVTASLWTLPLLAIPGNRTCLLNVDGIGWNMELSDEENLHRLTFAFITMGSLEVDGRLEELPLDKIAMLNKVMADMDRGHAVRCPDEDAFTGRPLPKCLYVDYPADSRTARRGIAKHIAIFNWTDRPQYTGYPATELGMSAQATVRDFWAGETEERPEGDVVAMLPPRSSRLYEVLAQRYPDGAG